ncbi:hypothetical protein E2542_SST16891 [Spatholobus suberectus]|nr:hypothetical protein E2542_SST16891 [Spatholobus suberectus]
MQNNLKQQGITDEVKSMFVPTTDFGIGIHYLEIVDPDTKSVGIAVVLRFGSPRMATIRGRARPPFVIVRPQRKNYVGTRKLTNHK